MGRVYVYRRAHFSASHRLFDPQLSDEKNFEIFGGCSNPNGHGHNYYIELCIAGEPDPKTGYVIDLKKVKNILRVQFLDKVDHKNLNVDVDFMKGINPTTENIAIAAWRQIAPSINEGKLYSVRIYETEKNFVEYRGE
ncbi:MAG: 6-carboxytetrahydropterin synthase [Ignavibacteriales bacterium]|nr:6-carboxytetrahydropterin synthase [Ignavibacteriales bacterium]